MLILTYINDCVDVGSNQHKFDEIDCLIQSMKLTLSPSIGPYDFDRGFRVAGSESEERCGQ